jgi:hypothetical protein
VKRAVALGKERGTKEHDMIQYMFRRMLDNITPLFSRIKFFVAGFSANGNYREQW